MLFLLLSPCVSSFLVRSGPSAVQNQSASHARAIVTTVQQSMPSGFPGKNQGLGSWFRANNAQDSTNGNSWCGYPYSDFTPGFAPDIGVMTNGTGAVWPHPNWAPSATNYCGLEAKVYNPATGVTMFLYLVDAFDTKWVRTPGSIDVMFASYNSLQQFTATDKNIVIKQLQWEFTGRRAPQYSFKGVGDPQPSLLPTAPKVVSPVKTFTAGYKWQSRVYAPYIDTIDNFDFVKLSSTIGTARYILGFVTADRLGKPAWGGNVSTSLLPQISRIQRVRQFGGDIAVSFGGPKGKDLAESSRTLNQLILNYQNVIDGYSASWIDFYLTDSGLSNSTAVELRSKALRTLQVSNPNIRLSLSLPVTPTGFDSAAMSALKSAMNAGVRIDVVNLLAMNFGGPLVAPTGKNSSQPYVISAAFHSISQIRALNSNATLGLTVMIGSNINETFGTTDALNLLTWAKKNAWVSLISILDANRDTNAGSGVVQKANQFSTTLVQFEN